MLKSIQQGAQRYRILAFRQMKSFRESEIEKSRLFFSLSGNAPHQLGDWREQQKNFPKGEINS